MMFWSFLLSFFLSFVSIAAAQQTYQTGMIPAPHIELPSEPDALKGIVFLISDAGGWGAGEDETAKTLAADGAVVVGIDFPSYMKALGQDTKSCVYMISDVESLSQQIQRQIGNATYREPIVAGVGEGGALALAMVSQSPKATLDAAIAVDPLAGIPLVKELCTPATKEAVNGRTTYGFVDGDLPAQVTIIQTENADVAGFAHAKALKEGHDAVVIDASEQQANAALTQALAAKIVPGDAAQAMLDLPLTELPTPAKFDTLAIFYSGDGGWRDLDSQVGLYFQAQGVPTVGIDSLRYFWSEKTPQQTADDLARIIETYRVKWNVSHVLLVGYSFGADVLPASYNLLPDTIKAQVPQISLLALSRTVDYEISVTGWLGAAGVGKGGDTVEDIAKIDPGLVQCFYGTQEDEDPCPTLKDRGIETTAIEGGHHFDGNYPALGQRLLDGLQRRLK